MAKSPGISFIKMHGLGNDFIVFACPKPSEKKSLSLTKKAVQAICDRRTGVGADQLLLIERASSRDPFDFSLTIWNQDGSRAEMCGNGLRCVAHLVKRKGLSKKLTLKWKTGAGLLETKFLRMDEARALIWTQMGKFKLTEKEASSPLHLLEEGMILNGVSVSLGNPHYVVFGIENEDEQGRLGPRIERNRRFIQGTNVEFVKVLSEKKLKVRVWERGSGFTKACGTGACASAIAGVVKGFLKPGKVEVELPGGKLCIWVNSKDQSVEQEGPSSVVFEGLLDQNLLKAMKRK